jgi:hypothetical protein
MAVMLAPTAIRATNIAANVRSIVLSFITSPPNVH